MDRCPCGSGIQYEKCCRPLIKGERPASGPEEVMRARYTAYVMKEIDYLFNSLHPAQRSDFDAKATRTWAENSDWHKLEILETAGGGTHDSRGTVEFVASYSEKGVRKEHRESAKFIKDSETWYFEKGEPVKPKQFIRSTAKTGRNNPCPCGSGKKYKKCCAA